MPIALPVVFLILMARVREETRAHGTEAGMRRGLAVTGARHRAEGVVAVEAGQSAD
ncbi:MAG TPA: hypothetical protein VHZ31_01195 [Solirubrobacteraceae bacterium]|nr:hypothetical protein [Solirubrobacteraceae bacterium]